MVFFFFFLGGGGNGRAHVMCLTIHMKNNYYSKQIYSKEFNGLFQIVPLVFFKFFCTYTI